MENNLQHYKSSHLNFQFENQNPESKMFILRNIFREGPFALLAVVTLLALQFTHKGAAAAFEQLLFESGQAKLMESADAGVDPTIVWMIDDHHRSDAAVESINGVMHEKYDDLDALAVPTATAEPTSDAPSCVGNSGDGELLSTGTKSLWNDNSVPNCPFEERSVDVSSSVFDVFDVLEDSISNGFGFLTMVSAQRFAKQQDVDFDAESDVSSSEEEVEEDNNTRHKNHKNNASASQNPEFQKFDATTPVPKFDATPRNTFEKAEAAQLWTQAVTPFYGTGQSFLYSEIGLCDARNADVARLGGKLPKGKNTAPDGTKFETHFKTANAPLHLTGPPHYDFVIGLNVTNRLVCKQKIAPQTAQALEILIDNKYWASWFVGVDDLVGDLDLNFFLGQKFRNVKSTSSSSNTLSGSFDYEGLNKFFAEHFTNLKVKEGDLPNEILSKPELTFVYAHRTATFIYDPSNNHVLDAQLSVSDLVLVHPGNIVDFKYSTKWIPKTVEQFVRDKAAEQELMMKLHHHYKNHADIAGESESMYEGLESSWLMIFSADMMVLVVLGLFSGLMMLACFLPGKGKNGNDFSCANGKSAKFGNNPYFHANSDGDFGMNDFPDSFADFGIEENTSHEDMFAKQRSTDAFKSGTGKNNSSSESFKNAKSISALKYTRSQIIQKSKSASMPDNHLISIVSNLALVAGLETVFLTLSFLTLHAFGSENAKFASGFNPGEKPLQKLLAVEFAFYYVPLASLVNALINSSWYVFAGKAGLLLLGFSPFSEAAIWILFGHCCGFAIGRTLRDKCILSKEEAGDIIEAGLSLIYNGDDNADDDFDNFHKKNLAQFSNDGLGGSNLIPRGFKYSLAHADDRDSFWKYNIVNSIAFAIFIWVYLGLFAEQIVEREIFHIFAKFDHQIGFAELFSTTSLICAFVISLGALSTAFAAKNVYLFPQVYLFLGSFLGSAFLFVNSYYYYGVALSLKNVTSIVFVLGNAVYALARFGAWVFPKVLAVDFSGMFGGFVGGAKKRVVYL